MSSLQELPHSLHQSHIPLQRPAMMPRRNLSPKEEKEALIRKIESVSAANASLSARQDHLNSCIYDLRKLLQLVGQQSQADSQLLHSQNEQLQKKHDRLAQTLRFSHKTGSHLQKCALYWGEFLQ